MLQGTTRRARPTRWAALPLLVGACAAPPQRATPQDRSDRGSPTLSEIFSIPGLHGEAPRLRSLSADGAFALVDFRDVERAASGERVWAADHSPHLVATAAGAHTLDASTALAARLREWLGADFEAVEAGDDERAEPANGAQESEAAAKNPARPERVGSPTWSSSGALLAVVWRGAVVLVDPAARSARVVYRDAPRAKDAADTEQRTGAVRALNFANDDRELELRTGKELFVLNLSDASAGPVRFEQLRHVTRALELSLERVQLSEDRTRAFATSESFGEEERDGARKPARWMDLESGRKLVLEGLADLRWLEGERLSPDGRFVFGVEVDRSQDPAPNIVPNYLTPRVSTLQARRDLADDLPPPRKLWMWDTRDGARRQLALPGETRFYFTPLGWAPQRAPGAPARYAFRRLSSDFRVSETWVWSEGDLRLVAVDSDPKWVGGPGGGARWRDDGRRITFVSESFAGSSTPGHAQLFELDVETGHTRQLTRVLGEVSSVASFEGGFALAASGAVPGRKALWLVRDDGSAREFDFGAAVVSAVRPSDDGARVVFALERLGEPAELHVLDSARGTHAPLTRTTSPEYLAHDWIRPEALSVRHSDGSEVWSHVYLPRASSLARPDRARPCVVFIHGAGYLQNVTCSMTEYAVNLMFHSRLAKLGYVVVDVDYRGSAGYGQKFRSDVQGHLGKLELEDIAAVIDELARRGVIDGARVGCYGGSYGGFLTLMALFTEPERWVCGAALRSVTDWRSYSAGYTQPRLGRPSTHPEAYVRSSPIDHAEKLEDPLLILHGLSDTNVFAQDSIRLMEKLIDLGKPFDAMLYPSQGHGFEDGPHWIDEYGRIERLFLEHLGTP